MNRLVQVRAASGPSPGWWVCAFACAVVVWLPGLAAALEGRVPMGRLPLGASNAYARAIALDLKGRHDAALAAYLEAVRAGGADVERARYHATLAEGMRKNLTALRGAAFDGRAHFSLGVEAANKLTALVRETGVVVRSLYALAERSLSEAVRLLPGIHDPAICLAGLYADAGELGRARSTIQLVRGQRLRPSEVYNLACYYHSIGDYDRALADLTKVITPYYRKWIQQSDDFHKLRGDPRLEALLRGPIAGVK